MGNTLKHDPGAFCWAELLTSDTAGAKKFYGDIMGWKADDDPMPDGGVYTMLRLAGGDVGALYKLNDELKSQGVPPCWQAYVTVEDAAAAAAKAKSLGGTIMKDAFDVMNVGSMAVLLDPLGAAFSVWEPKLHTGFDHEGDRPGTVCWNELGTTNPGAAGKFYSKLFGWSQKTMDMPGSVYTIFMADDKMRGGMFEIKGPMEGMPPAWLTYFNVADCDATAKQVQAKGGKISVPPTDIPNMGRFAIASDPQGATFCFIHKPS